MRLILVSAAGLALTAGASLAQTAGNSSPAALADGACLITADPGPAEAGCTPSIAQGAAAAFEQDEIAAASARAIVAATLAEADRRVANMKFVIGPPPRNMTKGRNPAP